MHRVIAVTTGKTVIVPVPLDQVVTARTEQFEETTLKGTAQVMLGSTPFTSFGSAPVLLTLLALLGLMSTVYLTLWRDEELRG